MSESKLKKLIEKKELELNALLEITQSINSNVPEDSLYKIFNFTLRSNLEIKKLALFVFDEAWACKVNFGTEKSFLKQRLDDHFKMIKRIHQLSEFEQCAFHEFDMVIPVSHKNETLALVFVGGLNHNGETNQPDDGLKFIQALTNIIIVAIENKKLARKQLLQEAFRKELEIASDVQQFLFPKKLPNTEHLKIEASYLPHDIIGGDYYDYIPINKNQFLICVADVSGKGIPAALMMSNFQASLRTLLRQTPNLTEIVEALNFQVLDNTKGEKFITTDLSEFTLLAYTDGLTETVNELEEEFGPEALRDYFTKNHFKDLKTIHQDIIVTLDGFKGKNGYRDDITLLTCRVE